MRLAAWIVIMAGLAGRASGQVTAATAARAGDTVRVWSETPVHRGSKGTVARSSGDTLVLSLYSPASRTWIDSPLATRNVMRLDVFEGRKPSRTRTVIGFASGAALGAGAGGYIAWAMSPLSCNTPCSGETAVDDVVSGFVRVGFGALVGAAVGSTVGYLIGHRPVEHWRRLNP